MMQQVNHQNRNELLTADAIRVDDKSVEFLRTIANSDMGGEGKVVIARVDREVILGLGNIRGYHSHIIDRAAKALLGRTVVTTNDPDSALPLKGITIEGAKFHVQEGAVMIYGDSLSFGGFRAAIFKEATSQVVARFITEELVRLRLPVPDVNQSRPDGIGLEGQTLPPLL